jgi:hypothetical protein
MKAIFSNEVVWGILEWICLLAAMAVAFSVFRDGSKRRKEQRERVRLREEFWGYE